MKPKRIIPKERNEQYKTNHFLRRELQQAWQEKKELKTELARTRSAFADLVYNYFVGCP